MTRLAPGLRTSFGASVLALAVLTGCGGTASDASPEPRSGASEKSGPTAAQGKVAARLRALEKARGVRVGAYAVDTGTGRSVSYRGGERFPFASSFKAMACGAVLRKARDSDPALMDRVIRYEKSDLADFSPVTEKHVGTGMTVADLCHATITRSDNTAGNLVLKLIGGPPGLTAFLRSLGDASSRSDRAEPGLNHWRPGEPRDTTTPAAWAGDLRALAVGDALAPPDRTRLVGWLKATVTGGERIRAGLPKTWTVGDKTGTAGVYGNAVDVAVAWPRPGAAPLVMAVLTTRPRADAEADEKAVAETARILADGLGD
ncbi:class A beta-lactamase [Actinomadura chibensis]|uniref:Class A beta-lactamase n=1 Tax=Actinomadura chibensis TaxID=392828 RepID=A0A5D0NQ72_9ACTN|nr:class A beta-lactamase [Actinomadura chibensis]TYB46459.1 class A beta-lactamase [Actinomadura chibensis]